MNHVYDMLIIGGGPAGYTAALYASRAGFDTLLLEKISPGGQMALTGEIENYPGFEDGIDGFALGMKMQQGAERFGAKTQYADATSLDVTDKIKKVYTSGHIYLTKTLVLATGAIPRKLELDNEESLIGRGIHYCAHCDGRFYKDKTVVVVGGGNSAVSDALYLSNLAKKVYLVHRRDKLRATKIYHAALANAKNVEFLWNHTPAELISEDRIKGIRLQSTITHERIDLSCDGVFVSIGQKPATEFLQGIVNLDPNGYIIADESTCTNIPGVFAAGDIRTKDLRQVVTAVADGAAAAYFAEKYLSEM